MMKLIVFTASYDVLRNLSAVYTSLDPEQKRELKLSLYHTEEIYEPSALEQMKAAVREADFVILDPHGMPDALAKHLLDHCPASGAQQVTVGGDSGRLGRLLRLGSLTGRDLEAQAANMAQQQSPAQATATSRLSPAQQKDYELLLKLRAYWQSGGLENMRNLLLQVVHLCGEGERAGWPLPEEPLALHGLSLFDPATRKCHQTLQDRWNETLHNPDAPTVAVLFMGSTYPVDLHPVVAGIMERIQGFANVLPIAFGSITGVDAAQLRELLLFGAPAGKAVGMVVNFIPFRLGSGPVGGDSAAILTMLEELKAPLLHPVFLSKRLRTEWEESTEGLSPGEFLVQMMLPELDGAIELFPIAAMDEEVFHEELNIKWRNLSLIEERADRLAAKIRRWLVLQTKSRQEKRLSIICYNYPPGEAHLFGGSFIDTFESVSRLLSKLKEEGYTVKEMSAAELREAFLQGGLVNSAQWSDGGRSAAMLRYPHARCEAYFRSSPYRTEMAVQWGEAPGEIMTDETGYLIPGLVNGNVFIGLQPARGIHEQAEKAYHDRTVLPPYQYQAFYHYIKEEFRADAILHVGTHGTLEFMAGKEAGMSGDCLPDELTGELPHLYYYYVGNPAEAMVAKRRSHAVLMSYQSPPFVESELYGEYTLLDALLNDYRQAEKLNPAQCPDIWTRISRKAAELHLEAGDAEDIEDEIYRMRRSLIPTGLHVLGEGYDQEEAASYMKFVLRHDRHGVRSLQGLVADGEGLDYERLSADNNTAELQRLDAQVSRLVNQYAETGEIPPFASAADAALQEVWIKTWQFGQEAFRLASSNQELGQLIRLLDGEYSPARLAGDAIRHPDILPTGYNLYQFDCRSVPSDTAAGRGAAIADNLVELYRERHGKTPDTIALVMWGLETSRTQGETFGQILRLMGVRIAGRSRFNQPVYEMIPLWELGRPRINVVANICGFFRDMFPNLLEVLNDLFRQVSGLDETGEENRFKEHTMTQYRKLLADGYEEAEAWDLACARIFGPAAAEYGTNLTKLVETKAWTQESELGESYLNSLKYVYSGASRGREAGELFASRLGSVELVAQVRSDHEHEVTDLDHFYEFFGGLAKSVSMLKGTDADIYISDTTGERPRTEDAAASIGRGLRTRLLNPKWINGLLEHPYHGAQKIAERFGNMVGLAATTGQVDSWMFSELHQAYVADEERSRQMEENNRFAYHQVLESLLESHQRRYWDASEKELEQLRSRYMELEGELEGANEAG
ncbi:cobaltochelatase subunit CobN [Paenibacillus sp. YN15]|uniref:cobaltochelatase subunit CobN n=1 Tax=Paenibacillus sp. YN15 TaxID=1742774 RepID=UPI0015EB6372|nr:cobaltochelatase subunit CobN [Paenibacillus sp. YN15]